MEDLNTPIVEAEQSVDTTPVETPSEQPVEGEADPYGFDQFKPEEPEAVAPEAEVPPLEQPKTYNFDGREYTEDQIQEALKENFNISKWKQTLTKKEQDLAKERERIQSQLPKPAQPPQPTLTPEEIQTQQWLEKQGFVRKDALEKELGQIKSFKDEYYTKQAMDQVLGELNEVQSHYKIDDTQKSAIWNYAVENDMTQFNMETVYIEMNRDKLRSGLTAEQAIKEREEAGAQRKAVAKQVGSASAHAPVKDSSLSKYVPDRDKDKPLSELVARAMSNV